MRVIALTLTAAFLATTASGQALRVAGTGMQQFEILYENPAYFGPTGVVPFDVEYVQITGEITEDVLRDVDVLWMPSSIPDFPEREAIDNWHRQGGTVLGLTTPNFGGMRTRLGFAIFAGPWRDDACSTGYYLGDSPLTDGAFGNVVGEFIPTSGLHQSLIWVLAEEALAGCPVVPETYLAWIRHGRINGPHSGGVYLRAALPFHANAFDPASPDFDPNLETLALNMFAEIASHLPVGESYCTPAAVNSTGSPARLQAFGSAGVERNHLTFVADSLPTGQVGYLMNSMDKAFVWAPAGSSGMLCLGDSIGRHTNAVGFSGTSGSFEVALDMTAIPTPNGPHVAQPGDTFHFQAWYRDIGTSNFTPAITVEFY